MKSQCKPLYHYKVYAGRMYGLTLGDIAPVLRDPEQNANHTFPGHRYVGSCIPWRYIPVLSTLLYPGCGQASIREVILKSGSREDVVGV